MSIIAFEGSSLAKDGKPLAVRFLLYVSPNRWADGLMGRGSPLGPPAAWVFAQGSSPTGGIRGTFNSAVALKIQESVQQQTPGPGGSTRLFTCSSNGVPFSVSSRIGNTLRVFSFWCQYIRSDGYVTVPLSGDFNQSRWLLGTLQCNLGSGDESLPAAFAAVSSQVAAQNAAAAAAYMPDQAYERMGGSIGGTPSGGTSSGTGPIKY